MNPALLTTLIGLCLFSLAGPARALSPESPEVRKMIDEGLAFLADKTHEELGGKCLIGLAFVKDDKADHDRVQVALKACKAAKGANNPGDIYSNGIALIFLCELNARRHNDLIDYFLGALKRRQKDHGAWGYRTQATGDTSQTQYGTLGFWEAHRNGFSLSAESVARTIDWVIRTQDPSGAWGYQGYLPKSGELESQGGISHSMVAAGLSNALVCADLCGLLRPGAAEDTEAEAEKTGPPTSLRVAQRGEKNKKPRVRPLSSDGVDRKRLFKAVADGQAWMKENFVVQTPQWNSYYLYSVERYKSFEELLLTDPPEEPEWYNQGAKYLQQTRGGNGAWSNNGGAEIDTAFSVLFLLRSTQKSLRAGLGDGVLVSGRGSPADLTRVTGVSRGELVVQRANTQVEDMLALLDEGRASELDAIADDPTALIGQQVDARAARRLQQIVRGGGPAARLLAVRALGRSGELDYAPTLIYALTDPDRRVVRAARDGLRFTSRRFTGFGLPDNFTDEERYEALDQWKSWYLKLRPNALLDVN